MLKNSLYTINQQGFETTLYQESMDFIDLFKHNNLINLFSYLCV